MALELLITPELFAKHLISTAAHPRSVPTMTKEDYDDPEVEERWCEQQRVAVNEYLQSQGVKHGRVGDWPAWHVAPYVSIWAIESVNRPEWIGWWVICGDLPTDYISASDIELRIPVKAASHSD
jgi:hypothetical protein